MKDPWVLETVFVKDQAFRLFVPEANAIQEAYAAGSMPFPYWSQVWPSSIALARFLLERPSLISGSDVLELGAGLGLPSLVAARFAITVTCSDKEALAVEAVCKSAACNGLTNVKARVIDWNQIPEDIVPDVLLMSDINYEPLVFTRLLQVIHLFLNRGTKILLATPQRLQAKDFIGQLLVHIKEQVEVEVTRKEGQVPISIVVLSRNS